MWFLSWFLKWLRGSPKPAEVGEPGDQLPRESGGETVSDDVIEHKGAAGIMKAGLDDSSVEKGFAAGPVSGRAALSTDASASARASGEDSLEAETNAPVGNVAIAPAGAAANSPAGRDADVQAGAEPNPRTSPEANAKAESKADPLRMPANAKQAPAGYKVEIKNGMVGQRYRQHIAVSAPTGESVPTDIGASVSPENGLRFSQKTTSIEGTPTTNGDVAATIWWSDQRGGHFFVKRNFYVNLDPAKSWVSREPDWNSVYAKPHRDVQYISSDVVGGRLAGASVRGRSHAKEAKFREDDFFIGHSLWSVMVVADGAGSASTSREGSRIVAKTVGRELLDSLGGPSGQQLADQVRKIPVPDANAQNADERKSTAAPESVAGDAPGPDDSVNSIRDKLKSTFLIATTRAIRDIDGRMTENNLTFRDFSSTLLATACLRWEGRSFVATLWIGDGAIAVGGTGQVTRDGHPAGPFTLMGESDGGEYAGQTVFLDERFGEPERLNPRVRIEWFDGAPWILAMSDGVSDARIGDHRELHDGEKWKALWAELEPALPRQIEHQSDIQNDPGSSPNISGAGTFTRLVEFLEEYTPQYHDDCTVAVLW